MSYTKQDLLRHAERLALDLRDAQAKLAELRGMIAASSLPTDEGDYPECTHCGRLGSVKNERQLEEHLENVHGEAARAS